MKIMFDKHVKTCTVDKSKTNELKKVCYFFYNFYSSLNLRLLKYTSCLDL